MILSDSYDVQESKAFFEQNYSHIYYIFYDVFITTEADLKQRGKRCFLYVVHISPLTAQFAFFLLR